MAEYTKKTNPLIIFITEKIIQYYNYFDMSFTVPFIINHKTAIISYI